MSGFKDEDDEMNFHFARGLNRIWRRNAPAAVGLTLLSGGVAVASGLALKSGMMWALPVLVVSAPIFVGVLALTASAFLAARKADKKANIING